MAVVALIAMAGMPRLQGSQTTDPIVVVGCIERADQVLPAATNVGTSVNSMTFVLIIKAAPAADAAAGVAVGTSGNTGSITTYRLDAAPGKLADHVGHRVEIAGRIDREVAQGHAAGTTVVDPVASAVAASMVPRIKVESIRMIAALCPR